eukprot:m.71860 g.71860  ORF g.71860 m.71860 type:complete len:854 (-) comp18673_c0_seq1:219-2780(-)
MFGGKSKRKAKMLRNINQEENPEKLWKVTGDLGEGSFGMVHRVQSLRETSLVAAAKVIPVKYEEELEDFVVEVDILTQIRHPGIVGLHGSWLCDSKLWLVIELCEGGALDDVLIELERGFDEAQIRAAGNQMLEGLAHLHDSWVIHRDLKAGNVLLKADGTVKLTDFGVSALNKKAGQKRDTFIGTPYWMAPEVVLCENSKDKPYDSKSDLWSFGVTMIEFAETSPPYHDMHPMRVLFKIPKAPSPALTDTQKWSDDFHSALAASVIKSPADRPTARELLAMPFYKGQTDKSPLRDLFKLFNADVTEVLQDLPRADATVASAGPAAASTAPAPTAGADTPAAPPLSAPPPSAKPGRRLAPLPPNGAPAAEPITGLAGELVALQHIRGALDSAKTSSAEEDNLSKAVGDQSKNYKTLTRTRQYVNDKGEIITVSTQRVVETSASSNKLMTIRRGMVNIDSDWKDAEAKRLAMLRKNQLRETKRVQREEQKECADLIEKLRSEREKCDTSQKRALALLEKELIKEKATVSKSATASKSRAEKRAAQYRKDELAKLSADNAREAKQLKQRLLRDKKMMIKDVEVSTPKSDLREEKRRASEAAASKAATNEAEFTEQMQQQTAQRHTEINDKVAEMTADAERSAMIAEHTVLRECERRRAALLREQMDVKQTILKHQLKGTFWMQKHQMHFRHEKESDQLLRLQEQKLSSLEKKFLLDQEKLPKRQRSSASTRKRELRKSLNRADRAQKLQEFDTLERTRMSAEETVLHQTYTETTDAMKEAIRAEAAELAQMQDTRKQLLVVAEQTKTGELELTHKTEAEQMQSELEQASSNLDRELTQQIQAHTEFYSKAAVGSM